MEMAACGRRPLRMAGGDDGDSSLGLSGGNMLMGTAGEFNKIQSLSAVRCIHPVRIRRRLAAGESWLGRGKRGPEFLEPDSGPRQERTVSVVGGIVHQHGFQYADFLKGPDRAAVAAFVQVGGITVGMDVDFNMFSVMTDWAFHDLFSSHVC
jgi:hypothetical protein